MNANACETGEFFRKYNCSYARFLKAYSPYPPEACLGMSCSEYLPGAWEQVEEWYKSVRDTGMPERRHNFRLTFEKGGGTDGYLLGQIHRSRPEYLRKGGGDPDFDNGC